MISIMQICERRRGIPEYSWSRSNEDRGSPSKIAILTIPKDKKTMPQDQNPASLAVLPLKKSTVNQAVEAATSRKTGWFRLGWVALAMVLFAAPHCCAQKHKVWTRNNIQEWIDSHQQKRDRLLLIQSMNRQDRERYNREGWFYPPQMLVTKSQPGQLGRLDLAAYKIMEVLDDTRVLFKVADETGYRYLVVFEFDDTAQVRIDHRPHEAPDQFKWVLFERVEDYVYRDSSNRREALPTFRRVDPAEVRKGDGNSSKQADPR